MLEMERMLRGVQRAWRRKKTYTFSCPTCESRYTYDEPGEPVCTGPHTGLDEHPAMVMHLVRVYNSTEKNVPPEVAAARASGPLWIPDDKES